MSVRKRYYSIASICDSYKTKGIEGVISSFNKVDAFMFTDNESGKIHQLIMDGSNNKAIKLIEKQINNLSKK